MERLYASSASRMGAGLVDQCLKMSNDPWTGGILPRKDIELISLAVNAACTNLSAGGTRRHIRGALEAGATRDEIMMTIKIASLLSIHTASLGAPILLEEAKAAGVKLAPKEAAATPVCDGMKAAGQWNTAWDGFFGSTRHGRKRSSPQASRFTRAAYSRPSWRSY